MVQSGQHQILTKFITKPLLMSIDENKEKRQNRKKMDRLLRQELKQKRKDRRKQRAKQFREKVEKNIQKIKHRIPGETKKYYLNVRVKEDLIAQLKDEAKKHHITISDLVREILKDYFS